MKMCLVQLFAVVCMAAVVLAEGIRLPPNQGIILPSSVASRLARAAYGAYGPAAGFQASSSSSSSSSSGASSGSGSAAPTYTAPSYSHPAPPAYSSVPAPQCANSYLFSCAPSLTPVPCDQRQASYGSSSGASSGGYLQQANPVGAYSDIIPQYANFY